MDEITIRKLTSIVYKTGVPIRFFIFFMSCLTAMMPLGCRIGDLWGKQEERRPGILKSGGAFQYVVAMETGNAQYLSNIEETYDFKILKGIDPEIVKVSGGKAYLFFKRAFDIVFAIVVGLVLFLFIPII